MMTAANSLVKKEAKKIVDRFVRRFDKSYRLLVYYAAIPLIVTPELLSYLRHQFLRGQVPWVAQVDLLLSDLFEPVGYELYAMDTAVRAYLLNNIEKFFHEQELDKKHLQEVALVLLGYIKYLANTNAFLDAPELEAQQWAAMVFLEDKKEQIFQKIKEKFQNCGSEAELARLTQITQELSPQLSKYRPLIEFAESVRDLLLDLKPDLTETTKQTITKVSQELEIDLSKFPGLGIPGGRSIGLNQILLVEDEPEVIQDISEVLSSQYGIAVRGTDDVNEVIKLAESSQIDLILINHKLPNSRYQGTNVDGLEIIRILRANPNISSSLPIVGFSKSIRFVANDFLESGADGYYFKQELLDSGNYQKFVDYLIVVFNRVKLKEFLPYERNEDLDSVLDLISKRHSEVRDTSEEDVSSLWNKLKGDVGTFYLLENLCLLDVLVMTASGKGPGTVRYDFSSSYLNQNSPRLYSPPDGDKFDDKFQQLPLGQKELLDFIKPRSELKQDTSLADAAVPHPQEGDIATYRRLENLRLLGFLTIIDLGTSKETIRYNLSQKYQKYLAYTQLRSFLEAKQWQEADRKTAKLMYLIANRVEEEWLRREDIEQFPCDDLLTIDQLWIKASHGHFGFTVQQRIYKELGGTKEYQSDIWRAFGDSLGWRVEEKWLSYSELNFDLSAPTGHLPMGAAMSQNQLLGSKRLLFSRLQVCQLEKSEKVLDLQAFEFETVTVNRSGEIIKRETKTAQYYTEPLSNDVSLDMVAIPGGTFMMASPEEYYYEQPQHEVNVPPFFMGKYPVTQAQWRGIASLPKVKRYLKPDPSHFKGDNRPVEQVSWYDAVEFCQRLSLQTGKEYRLPSEAEWEYACRAGTTTPFYFGETITTDLANYNGNYIYASEPKGVDRGETTPLGSFPPNAFGLYDMHGNVWEWCADTLHYNNESPPTDVSAWTKGGDDNSSLLRGGCWTFLPGYCGSAFRWNGWPDSIKNGIGFRVVCSVGKTRHQQLENYLKNEQWKEADQETYRLMIQTVGKEVDQLFDREEIENFPCEDLHIIDQLWVKYSSGHFGFSVQKNIWQECDSPRVKGEDWNKFASRVGWRKGEEWIDYNSLTFDLSAAPKGQLPASGWWARREESIIRIRVGLFSRAETCNL